MTNHARPLRLVAQDIGFSVQRQGFDSPRGYISAALERLSFCPFRIQSHSIKGLTAFHQVSAPWAISLLGEFMGEFQG